jgi:hypothetical protein
LINREANTFIIFGLLVAPEFSIEILFGRMSGGSPHPHIKNGSEFRRAEAFEIAAEDAKTVLWADLVEEVTGRPPVTGEAVDGAYGSLT